MAMEFLPQPKRADRRSGNFALTPHTRVVLAPGTAPGALLYAQMLQSAFRDHAGLTPALGRGASGAGDITLTIGPNQHPAHYTLTVAP